jgi:glycosyltransferase involved in cell wall biosynthesis
METITPPDSILFIGGWNLVHGPNHSSRHMANYFARRFETFDMVGFDSFAGGLAANSSLEKLSAGISALRNEPVRIEMCGSARLIVARDIPGEFPFDLGLKERWRFSLLKKVLRKNYRALLFGNPAYSWLVELLLREGFAEKVIYLDWDYMPALWPNPVAKRVITAREGKCVRSADMVLSVNGLLADLRKKQGARQVEVIPNGTDLNLFTSARQKIPHPPTLVYMGSLNADWHVDLAIRAMPQLKQVISGIRLIIAGSGKEEGSLKILARDLQVTEDIEFLGFINYQELPQILARADIGLATSLTGSNFRKFASPLKIIEYMAAGLPVIASRIGQSEIVLQESRAGILIEDSIEELVNAARLLLGDTALYLEKVKAGISYSANFDWDILMEKAYHFVVEAISEKA